jgi:hypothetical protein
MERQVRLFKKKMDLPTEKEMEQYIQEHINKQEFTPVETIEPISIDKLIHIT